MMLSYPAVIGRRCGFDRLQDDLHGSWLRKMLLGQEDMTLQSHRGSYKTTCLSVALAEMLVVWPDRSIIFMRKTDDDVVEVVKQVQALLAGDVFSSLTREVYGAPVGLTSSNSTQITTSVYSAPRGAAQLLGIGIGGSLTGKHADIIITDDIINLKDRVSRAEREHTKAIYQELQNVRNPGGRIINTGTPWHPDDAFQLMPDPLRYDCYTTGLLTQDKLAQLRRSMAPSLFAANYELKHIAAENALFATSPEWVEDESLLWDGIAHVDAAYGGEDYTALTCAKRHGDEIVLYGRLWHAHVETCMDAILAEVERMRCAPVYVETNADKGYLAKELRGKGASIRSYHETTNKYQKISTYLRKWWSSVFVLAGTDPAYIAQILDYSEDAEHDDAPDSAACACRVLDRRLASI